MVKKAMDAPAKMLQLGKSFEDKIKKGVKRILASAHSLVAKREMRDESDRNKDPLPDHEIDAWAAPKKAAKGLLKKVKKAIAAHIKKGNPAVVKVLKKVKAVVKSNPSPAKKDAVKKILKKVDKMDKTASANKAAVAKLKKDAKAAKMAKLAMTELQKTKAAALHESESMQKKLMKAKMQIQQLKRA